MLADLWPAIAVIGIGLLFVAALLWAGDEPDDDHTHPPR